MIADLKPYPEYKSSAQACDFAMTMRTRNDFIATADFAMIHPEACGSLALLTDPILRAQRAAVPTPA